jgi:hypothetical protein
VDFVVTVTVEQLKIVELIVLSIVVFVMNLQQVIGTKAESAFSTAALLSIQQKDDSFR